MDSDDERVDTDPIEYLPIDTEHGPIDTDADAGHMGIDDDGTDDGVDHLTDDDVDHLTDVQIHDDDGDPVLPLAAEAPPAVRVAPVETVVEDADEAVASPEFRRALNVGMKIDVLDTYNKWYSSSVLKVRQTDDLREVYVSYDGWPSNWDEWLDIYSDRIRKLVPRLVGTSNGEVTILNLSYDKETGAVDPDRSSGEIRDKSFMRMAFDYTQLVNLSAGVRKGDSVRFNIVKLGQTSYATQIEVTQRKPLRGRIGATTETGGAVIWSEFDQTEDTEAMDITEDDNKGEEIQVDEEQLQFVYEGGTLNKLMQLFEGDAIEFVRDFDPERQVVFARNVVLVDPVLRGREFGKYTALKGKQKDDATHKIVRASQHGKKDVRAINTKCVIGNHKLGDGDRISFDLIDGEATRIMKLEEKKVSPQQKRITTTYKKRLGVFKRTASGSKHVRINYRKDDSAKFREAIDEYNAFVQKIRGFKDHNIGVTEIGALKAEALKPLIFYLQRDFLLACVERGFRIDNGHYDQRLEEYVDKNQKTNEPFTDEELEKLRSMTYDVIMKAVPVINDELKVDVEAVPTELRRDAMKHIRIFWKSRLEVSAETSVYVFVKMPELGDDEVPYKLNPISEKNMNFLMADLWIPRPEKARILLCTYMFGVHSAALGSVKMVPNSFRFESHLVSKYHTDLIGVGFLGLFGSIRDMFQNFTTRTKSHEEEFCRMLIADLERGDIRVQDAVDFADTVLFKPKLREKHEKGWTTVTTNKNDLMDIGNLKLSVQQEFYDCILNPNTPRDCKNALFVILGLRAKVSITDLIKVAREIPRMYDELDMPKQCNRANFNSFAELLIDVWRNDREHKDGLRLIPLWNAIDKARVESGNSRYHKVVKMHVVTDPLFELHELLDCKDRMGGWYPATIMKIDKSRIFVHYTNYSERWDEWIDRNSDRVARLGKFSARKHGKSVTRDHDIEINYGNEPPAEFVQLFEDALTVDLGLGAKRNFPIEVAITEMIPEDADAEFVDVLLKMNDGTEDEGFLLNMMHDRALGRLLTSPKNGTLWLNVLTTYNDRGMMGEDQILRRFEDCLLGHINKPKSTVEEMMQWLPVVLEEFPQIWTVASRAAFLRKECPAEQSQAVVDLAFRDGISESDPEIGDIFLRDASAFLSHAFDQLKESGSGILEVCCFKPALESLFERACISALAAFVTEVLPSSLETVKMFMALDGVERLGQALFDVLLARMCELKWNAVKTDPSTVRSLQDALAVCLKRGQPHSLRLCRGVLDRLLHDQMPIVEEVADGEGKRKDETFLIWLLGTEAMPDHESLPLLVASLHHTTSIPFDGSRELEHFLANIAKTLKATCAEVSDMTVTMEIISRMAKPTIKSRFDLLCQLQRRTVQLEYAFYSQAIKEYTKVFQRNQLMDTFQTFYVSLRPKEMKDDLKKFATFVDETNKIWDQRQLGPTAKFDGWEMGDKYETQLQALFDLHKNHTFLGIWKATDNYGDSAPEPMQDDSDDDNDDDEFPLFPLVGIDSEDEDEDERKDDDDEIRQHSLFDILFRKFGVVMMKCFNLSDRVIKRTLTRGDLAKMQYLEGKKPEVVKAELATFVNVCHSHPNAPETNDVSSMAEAVLRSHKFAEMSGFLRILCEVAGTISSAISQKSGEPKLPEEDFAWKQLLAVLEKEQKEKDEILVIDASDRITELRKTLPAEFTDLQVQWIRLLANKPDVLLSMTSKEFLVDDTQFNSLLEVIQANPLNALEGQKAASLRNVRSTLLRLLDTPMATMSDVLNLLLAQKVNEKGVSDLQIVTESLESFSRKYKDVGSIDLVHDNSILSDALASFVFRIPSVKSSSDPPATARECYQLRVESMNETLNADQLSNLRDRLLLSVQPDDKEFLERVTAFEKTIDRASKISLARVEYYLEGGRDGLSMPPVSASAVPLPDKAITDIEMIDLSAVSLAPPSSALERAVSGDERKALSSALSLPGDEGDAAGAKARSRASSVARSDGGEPGGDEDGALAPAASGDDNVDGASGDGFLSSTSIVCKQPIDNWDKELDYWQTKLTEWRARVTALRTSFPALNYFPMNEILSFFQLISKPDSSDAVDKLHVACQVARRLVTRDQVESVMRRESGGWRDALASGGALATVGGFLTEVCALVAPDAPQPNTHLSGLIQGEPNLYLTNAPLSCLMKLFSQRGSSPSAEQVLLCAPDTTAEETQCLILRCLDDVRDYEDHKDNYSRLYVMVGVEHLTYVTQIKLIEQLHHLQASKDLPYAFAIVTQDKHNRVVSRMREFERDPVRMQPMEIKQTYAALFRFKHLDGDDREFDFPTPMVRVFSSARPGTGKSFVVRNIARKHASNNYVRIPFNGDVNVNRVIAKLESPDLLDEVERVYHVNVSSSASDIVNVILFKLLVLGHINTAEGKRYTAKTADSFLIELPTNISVVSNKPQRDTVEDKFYFLAQSEGFPRYVVTEENNPLQIGDMEQYVFKWLRAYNNDELKCNEEQPDFDHTQAPDIEPGGDEWKNLLSQFCPQARHSMILTTNFIRYMHGQLEQVEANIFLKNFNKPREDIFLKHMVVQSLVASSQDFSAPSYQRAQVDDDNKFEFADETTGVESFEISSRWQQQGGPMFLLNQSDVARSGGFGDLSILVHDLQRLPRDVHQTLTQDLQFKMIDFQREEERRKEFIMKNEELRDERSRTEKLELLLRVFGSDIMHDKELATIILATRLHGFESYALTFDNILKMFAIYFRVKSRIPVVLMGETGCGKTALVEFLCKALDVQLFQFDVHGGYTEEMIEEKMDVAIKAAKADPHGLYWVFFDEVNTCEYLGVFNEILCDRSLEGDMLPENLAVLAACNPYRRHRQTGKLVYRVHPLPETMKEYVWNFGSLSAIDERQYIGAMLSKADERQYVSEMLARQLAEEAIRADSKKLQKDFVNRIVKSQEFLRAASEGEVSVVSLRDVARCVRLFCWFFARRDDNINYSLRFYESMILALAHCYYYRLDVTFRKEYARLMDGEGKKRVKGVRAFNAILKREQERYIDRMREKIPDGIAVNNMLRENIFMVLVCIMTKTPLVIVGKPGSSKTLAMSIVRDSLATSTKSHGLSKLGFGDISNFQFQCSKLSTAAGIKSRFDAALNFQNQVNADRVGDDGKESSLSDENKLHAGVFLDEVGLAEQSPFLPLKVLHQLLEHPKVWFVALSNWSLDSAKMNRMVFHNCPVHTEDDLVETAEAIVASYAHKGGVNQVLSASLPIIAQVYHRINEEQPYKNFFGSREFYSIVQFLSRALQGPRAKEAEMSDDLLLMAFLRNFGGLPPEVPSLEDRDTLVPSSEFLAPKISRVLNLTVKSAAERIGQYASIDLVRENINETRNQADQVLVGQRAQTTARNVMVLCDYESTWQLLFDRSVINHEDAVVLFGSQFTKDKNSSLNIFQNINHIKNCMETGKIVVLIDLDELYDSLYDMLNQSWTTIGDQKYCRVALGAESVMCKVHPRFKCVVVVNAREAHTPESQGGIPTAFLNRFEKQLISRQALITGELGEIEKRVLQSCKRILRTPKHEEFGSLPTAFCGFNSETIPSLLLSIQSDSDTSNGEQQPDEVDAIIRKCQERLLWVCSPEQILAHNQSGPWSREKFFEEQDHSDLISLLSYGESHDWDTGNGQRMMAFTHDYLQQEEMTLSFKESDAGFNPLMVNVSDFETQVEFTRRLFDFFSPENDDENTLIVQCDLRECGVKHIMHVKYLVEKYQSTAVTEQLMEQVKMIRQSSLASTIDEEITQVQTVLERRRSELEEQEGGADALGAIDEEAAVMSKSKSKSALDESKQSDDADANEMKTTSSSDVIEPSRGSKSERTFPKVQMGTVADESEDKKDDDSSIAVAGGGGSALSPPEGGHLDDDLLHALPPLRPDGGDALPRMPTKKHVVLLIHSDRGKNNQFPLVYEKTWKFVFIDALIPAKHVGISSIKSMASRDLASQIGDDMRGLAQRTFKKSVARLSFDRPVIGIQPIHAFEKLMSSKAWDEGRFFKSLQDKLSRMLHEVRQGRDESVVELVIERMQAAKKRQMAMLKAAKGGGRVTTQPSSKQVLGGELSDETWLRGSFRFEVVAFTDTIVRNCFGQILAKLYCNSHLDLYSPKSPEDHQKRWLALFDDPKLFALPKIDSTQVAIHVPYDLPGRFPFSTYLHSWFENQRPHVLEIAGFGGNIPLFETKHLSMFDGVVKSQQFDFLNYFPRGDDLALVFKSYGHDISFFARLWSHTTFAIDTRYAELCANILFLYAHSLRDSLQLWDVQCALWALDVPLRHVLNIVTALAGSRAAAAAAAAAVGGRLHVHRQLQRDAVLDRFLAITAKSDSVEATVVNILQDTLNVLNADFDVRDFCSITLSIQRDVEFLLSFLNKCTKGEVTGSEAKLRSQWLDIEYRQAFSREVLIPTAVTPRKVENTLNRLQKECAERNQLDCLLNLLKIFDSLFPKDADELRTKIDAKRKKFAYCFASFLRLHLSRFCFLAAEPPSKELLRVLVQIIGAPAVDVDLESPATCVDLSTVCTEPTKREILRQLWDIKERAAYDVDAYVENVLVEVHAQTRHYDSPMAVLVLRSLENQIIRSLTVPAANALRALRDRYLPKKEVGGGKTDEEEELKREDDEEEDDMSMSDEDDEQPGNKRSPGDEPVVEVSALPKLAQARAALAALVERNEDLQLTGDASSVKTLRRLAWIRLSLTAIAELLSAPTKIRHDLTPSDEVCHAVTRFMTPTREGDRWSKRLHLFLFKVLDRAAGFQAAQQIVTSDWSKRHLPFVADSPMFNQIEPPRANVPQSDIFMLMGDRYVELRKNIRDALISKDATKTILKRLGLTVQDRPPLLGTLVELCYFRENTQQRSIKKWLEQRNVEECFRHKRELALFKSVATSSFTRDSHMQASPRDTLERSLMMRCVFHLAAVAFEFRASPLCNLLTRPEAFKDGHLIGMPDDLMSALAYALGNAYVWLCPNGHPYMVGGAGECAWPMERTQCAFDGCDATIGGRSHAEEGGNKIQREYLNGGNENFPGHKAVKAPKGYVLRGGADEARDHGVNRPSVSDVSVKILRFFLHALLLVSHSHKKSTVGKLLHEKKEHTIAKYLNDQITAEFQAVQRTLDVNAEDTAMALHQVIHLMNDELKEQDHSGTDLESRLQFEQFFTEKCVNPVINNLNDRIRDLKDLSVSASLKYLANEVNETMDLSSDLGKHYREENLPLLFLLRPEVNFQVFSNLFISNPYNERLYKNLWHFVSNVVALWPLKYLPDIMTWQRLVYTHYMRKLSPEEAKEKTVADVFRECEEHNRGDLQLWRTSWDGFRKAWNYLASRMESQDDTFELRYECEPIKLPTLPEDPEKVPIVYSLCTNEDTGRMCLEVISYLVSCQNDFLKFLVAGNAASAGGGFAGVAARSAQPLDEEKGDDDMAPPASALSRELSRTAGAMGGDENHDNTTGLVEIPVEVATLSHVITLDARELDEIVSSASSEISEYGKRQPVKYDCSILEREIVDRFLGGKALLLKSAHYFEFAGDFAMDPVLEALEREIPQEALDEERYDTTVDQQFDSQHERVQAFESLKEAMMFLSRVGGSPTQYVYRFMRDVLGLHKLSCEPFRGRRGKRLQLQHVNSLFSHMEQAVIDNGADRAKAPPGVLDRYCDKIPVGIDNENGALGKFMLGLRHSQRVFLVKKWRSNLRDYAIAGAYEFPLGGSLKNHLMGTIYPEENPWIVNFPDGLQVRHWGTAFEFSASMFYRNR